jgi:hypothetical protein
MDLVETGWESVDWIMLNLVQNGHKGWAFLNVVMNLRIAYYAGNLVTS